MELEIQGEWKLPQFDLASLRTEGYILLGLYILLLLILLYLRRQDFQSLSGRKLPLWLLFLALTVPLNNVLWLRFPAEGILPPPGVPAQPPAPGFPLIGMLAVMLTGVFLGAGPAMLSGLVAGLVRGGLHSLRFFTPTELAVVGFIVGLLLTQTYRGRDWRLWRQPVGAALIGAGCHWVLLWVDIYFATPGERMSALDYTQTLMFASTLAIALDSLVSGVLVQGVYLFFPRAKPYRSAQAIPPHLRSMNRRLLAAFLPLTFVMMLAMFYAVTSAAISEATNQAIDVMSRGANNASQMLPHFFNTGQELLSRIAEIQELQSPDDSVRQQALADSLQIGISGPFFSQFLLFDQQDAPRVVYPHSLPAERLPGEEELIQRALDFGAPAHSSVLDAQGDHVISFVVPVFDQSGEKTEMVLVGRALLGVNPTINQILASLQWLDGNGVGFVVDERGRIALHPDPDRLLQPWENDTCSTIATTSVASQAYQDLDADGTRRLVYCMGVRAMSGWTIVITHPYEIVLDRATRISGPLLLILLIVSAGLAIIVPWVTSRLTRPLQALAAAARNIAQGQLDTQIDVLGEDEVGQLGNVFEQMRLSLKDRLDDLSLLLRVSQAVSSSLDISQSIPPILEGALQATDAHVARLILLDASGEPHRVISQGEQDGYVTALDRVIARLGRGTQPILIENTARVKEQIDPRLTGTDIRALIAVPMRSKDHLVGVMWLGYGETHSFGATEVDFLATLASQAAVAVENSQLFQAAEGGRRRLSAILESTSDLIIVTDHANQVLLLNPAAAEVFSVDAHNVSGQPIAQVIREETVLHLLTAPLNDGAPLTGEVPLPDGRTFYASASAIVSGDGQAIGRVAVLRDITYLKEMDDIKSEFVATVSHDLRAPLTFMRGYATMIPMVDEVSPKQKEYVDKILIGIEQMTELIEDLLDLGRIEAGVGLRKETCRLDEIIVGAVDSARVQAKAKGLALRLDHTEDMTLIIGDAALLRRIISNLLDNAIKYTPRGGTVTVGWETRGDRVRISVTDTGIGIAKRDQARLFEKFSRIKRRETINIKGSGLGLAIVKSIAERHHGRVWVESELGQGSTFFVELPVGQVE